MRPHPVELFLRTVVARAYPRVIGQMREPSWVFFDIAIPLMTTVGLVFFYRALSAPEEFLGFVILGGAMAAFWMNVLWNMAHQLYCPYRNRLQNRAHHPPRGLAQRYAG